MDSLRCSALATLALWASGCDALLPPHDAERDPRIVCDAEGCTCAEGYADCDGESDNGCESDLAQPETCGSCGHDCLGGICSGGDCGQVTVYGSSTFLSARFAALRDDRVYLAELGPTVSSLRPAAPPPLPATDFEGFGESVAVGEGSLFYTAQAKGSVSWNLLQSPILVDPILEPPTHTVVIAAGSWSAVGARPTVLGASAKYVYVWGEVSKGPLALHRVSRESHESTSLSKKVRACGAGGGRAFWIEGDAMFMVSDENTESTFLADVSPMTAQADALLWDLASDGDFVYAVTVRFAKDPDVEARTDVWEIDVPAGTLKSLHHVADLGNVYAPRPLAIDASYVYLLMTDADRASLLRFSRSAPGEEPKLLSDAVGQAIEVEVTERMVYWSNLIPGPAFTPGGGTLHRLVKPAELR